MFVPWVWQEVITDKIWHLTRLKCGYNFRHHYVPLNGRNGYINGEWTVEESRNKYILHEVVIKVMISLYTLWIVHHHPSKSWHCHTCSRGEGSRFEQIQIPSHCNSWIPFHFVFVLQWLMWTSPISSSEIHFYPSSTYFLVFTPFCFVVLRIP